MRALVAERTGSDLTGLRSAELPDPVPGAGHLLIRVHTAPVNPADLMMLAGTYLQRPDPPFVPGVTGVGTVIGAHAGLPGRLLTGRRVTFAPAQAGAGSWAELALSTPRQVMPLRASISDDDAVNLLANATTSLGVLRTLRAHGYRAAVITAAASEVGQMMNTASHSAGVQLVNIVRRPTQAQALTRMGADHVLDSSQSDFPDRLAEHIAATGASAAVDSISGPWPALLLHALPPGSTLWTLGRLSNEPVTFDALDLLVGRHQTLRGFDVLDYLENLGTPRTLRLAYQAQRLMSTGYRTQVAHRADLDTAAAHLADLTSNPTTGKTLLYPDPAQLPHR